MAQRCKPDFVAFGILCFSELELLRLKWRFYMKLVLFNSLILLNFLILATFAKQLRDTFAMPTKLVSACNEVCTLVFVRLVVLQLGGEKTLL